MFAKKLTELLRRKGVAEKSSPKKQEAKPESGEGRQVSLAPVLRPHGARTTLSDGCVRLANAEVIDLEAAERFRHLRAQIERESLLGVRQEVLAVSSAVPSEGKSVVAVNLGRAFGADPRGKTLLIDCDLRKPNVHRFFDSVQSPGLSDVLVAGKSVESVVQSVEPGLDLITAGSPVVDSTRTLEQPGMKLLLAELKKRYRYVILDCPPVLLCSEMLSLSHAASASILVVRAWRTERQLVKDAVNLLGKKAVLGVVLNDCTDTLTQYGYYGYYGYQTPERPSGAGSGAKARSSGNGRARAFFK